MTDEFTMPKLGLTMTEGIIREWLVDDGAFVRAGQPVLMIETDKVETEVEARGDGFLRITGVVGSTYECGDVIGHLFDQEDSVARGPSRPAGAPVLHGVDPSESDATVESPTPPAVDQPAPAAPVDTMGAGVGAALAARGDHGRILASPRARAIAAEHGVALDGVVGSGPAGRIRHDDVIAALRIAAERAEADRSEAERIRAERAADRADAVLPVGEDVGDVELAELERLESEWFEPNKADEDPSSATPVERTVDRPRPRSRAGAQPSSEALGHRPGETAVDAGIVPATAAARQLADFLGVNLADLPVVPGERISREAVGAWVRERLRSAPAPGPESAPAEPPAPTPPVLLQEPTDLIPFVGARGIIANRMHASLQHMAQLTLSVDVDMAGVNDERERRRARGETVPGYTAWVVAAAAQALGRHPYVNSQVTPEGLALLPDIHVGVAVALDDGLIVPVIEHADVRSVEETHQVVADMAGRARNNKLKLHELEGATFSVTALGMFGVDMFTPVINPPNTAILGVGRLRSETVWRDGQPTERTVMTLSLTWDHRAFDGAPAAEFAQTIVRTLEAPAELV